MTTKDLVPKKAGNKVYYQLDYDVVVFFGFTETRAQLCWMSEVSHDAIPFVISYSNYVSRDAKNGKSHDLVCRIV